MTNLVHILMATARAVPDAPALLDDRGIIDYETLAERVLRVAGALKDLGVKTGDRVLYQLPNSPMVSAFYFSVLAAGGVAVPVNPLLTRDEVDTLRYQTAAKLFVSSNHPEADLAVEHNWNVADLPSSDPITPVDISPRSPATIFFTSGTTGQPKGIVLSHENIRSNAEWVGRESLDGEVWGPGTIVTAVLPLSHSFGLTCTQNAPLLAGGAVTYRERFEAADLIDHFVRHRVTTTALVPSAARLLLEVPGAPLGDLCLRHVLIGGAPIPEDLVADIESTLNATVLEGYGLTEASPVCAFRTPQTARKPGSVGRPAGYAELALRTDSNALYQVGEGELMIRGPGVFENYLGSTDSPLASGWLPTGDIARIDRDGCVFIIDRKKDLIIRNGYNISPIEVETVVSEHPDVLDAGVVGVADDVVGEEVVAYTVTTGQWVTESDILAHCRERLARYKIPGSIRFVSSVPRGSKGQVLRGQLRLES